MHHRVRGFVYVGLSSVGGCKHEVIASLGQGHRRDDGFVEIITSGTGAATLHLYSSGIGAEYKDFTRGHLNLSFLCRSEFPPRWDTPRISLEPVLLGRLEGTLHVLARIEGAAGALADVVVHRHPPLHVVETPIARAAVNAV